MAKKEVALRPSSEILIQISKDTSPFPQASRLRYSTRWAGVIKKSLRGQRSIHPPRPAEAEGREEARHEGA